ncbi:hypothetical protein C2U56_05680 [Pseudomonas fluorescens]|nr:hypothetical protein C2U56_05680 [Pseudomonas fluorescens]
MVWVKPNQYWRMRVQEDEAGRDARGFLSDRRLWSLRQLHDGMSLVGSSSPLRGLCEASLDQFGAHCAQAAVWDGQPK